MQTFSHTITTEELAKHPEVFVEGAEAGMHVFLKANDLAVLGITKHVITEDDKIQDPDLDLEVGTEVDVPASDAFSTVQAEKEAMTPKEENPLD